MKAQYVFLICTLLITFTPSVGRGESALHTFTTPDGRSLNAVIKEYNTKNGKIQIEREDGKKLWTLPTVFSEPDQDYIQQWIVVDQFMSPMKFKIEGKKTSNKISEHKTEIKYEITLENKTDIPFKNIKIEYRAFILNKSYTDKGDSNWVGGGQLDIAEVPAGKTTSQKTQPINLITQSSPCCGKTGQDKLEGFWIKVYGPEINGKTAIREWCHPSDTSDDYAWQNKTTRPPLVMAASPRDTHKYSDRELELFKEAGRLWSSDPEKALELYHEAYKIEQAPRAASGIGRLHLYRLKPTNIPLGLEWLEKAASENDFGACDTLAKFYATSGEPEYCNTGKAIEYGIQAVSINPSFSSHSTLATAYAHDGQFDMAVEYQKLAIEIYIKFYKKREDRSPSRLSKMEAILELYKNDELDKESDLIDEAFGYWKSNPEKALEIYHEAYEIAQSPRAANAIGKLHLYQLNPPNIPLGIEWMEKAVTGNDFNATACLASIYASYKYPEYHDIQKALGYGLKAISISPNDGWGHRILAGAYAEDGKFKKAVEHQKLSIKIYRDTSRHEKDSFERYLSTLESELELYKNNESKYRAP